MPPKKPLVDDRAPPAKPVRVHTRGMAPRIAPPKAWDSSKPPGGKLPPARKPKPST